LHCHAQRLALLQGKTLMTNESPEKIQPALLTIPQVCAYLNIARPTFYKINATGAFGLLPVKLGTLRKVLYSRAESTPKAMANSKEGDQTMKTKEAAVLPAAGTNKLHAIAYRTPALPSSLKLAIGELLLFGDKQQRAFWPLFEAMLVQFYQGVSQSGHEGRDMALESTISRRPE